MDGSLNEHLTTKCSGDPFWKKGLMMKIFETQNSLISLILSFLFSNMIRQFSRSPDVPELYFFFFFFFHFFNKIKTKN